MCRLYRSQDWLPIHNNPHHPTKVNLFLVQLVLVRCTLHYCSRHHKIHLQSSPIYCPSSLEQFTKRAGWLKCLGLIFLKKLLLWILSQKFTYTSFLYIDMRRKNMKFLFILPRHGKIHSLSTFPHEDTPTYVTTLLDFYSLE